MAKRKKEKPVAPQGRSIDMESQRMVQQQIGQQSTQRSTQRKKRSNGSKIFWRTWKIAGGATGGTGLLALIAGGNAEAAEIVKTIIAG